LKFSFFHASFISATTFHTEAGRGNDMYRKMKDFQRVWEYEASETLKIFNALTDQSLPQKVTETGRSLGFIAWHIVTTIEEFFRTAGIKIEAPAPETETPETVAEIVAGFEKAVKALNEELPKHWQDENLTDKIPMYGETWAKGFALTAFLMHAAHHRGQMTVLMRQAGLTVHGVYGPAKEEWEAMGMAALA
jgi:uncharacterized damage-inducible protein DinB